MEHPQKDRYPAIADYAMIGDCRCAALVSRTGSVDWCCMPRFDEDSCFGRLLDWEKGGYCAIASAGMEAKVSRRYLPRTMILETRFSTADGEAVLYDLLGMTDGKGPPSFDHIRIVEGVRGELEFEADIVPRFDYGEIKPHLKQIDSHAVVATGSNKGLIFRADFALEIADAHRLQARFRVQAGRRLRLLMRFETPERIDEALALPLPNAADIDSRFDYTRKWWNDWTARTASPFELDAETLRSLIVLKALTYEPTGAVVAAPTTSLPEAFGGQRNWDYRYSWIRDSVFVVRALERMGYSNEAEHFHRFIQRSCAGSADQLQIMYGVDGKRRLNELELHWMDGYRGSRPVRIGNGAAKQKQSDIYGELLLMAWEWHASGHRADADYWAFLCSVVNAVCEHWREPDHGIWELRAEPRHFVHSKAMCWAAVDRGIRLAQDLGEQVPLGRWRDVRDSIRHAIDIEGCDPKRGVYVQSFGSTELDAALLLLPRIGLVDDGDMRMVHTVDAIRDELDAGGLILRYRAPDGLPDSEGTFLPCTFWLVACLARQGRHDDAWRYYRRAMACANDVGLLSEEFDTGNGEMLGNFPQALTHVSQVMARIALDESG